MTKVIMMENVVVTHKKELLLHTVTLGSLAVAAMGPSNAPPSAPPSPLLPEASFPPFPCPDSPRAPCFPSGA